MWEGVTAPAWCLPGRDEVLSEVDADGGAGDGHVPVAGAVQLTADLNLSSGYLTDLVDFRTLSADDGTDQLSGQRRETVTEYAGAGTWHHVRACLIPPGHMQT